ncbi:MAG: LysM peptidoglycan-binding domain-containing protein [Anaerolineaceae bacterium]|nr:LysM peptidoglycan-binding domain-containing protein [Anaerolineaceae bacterium]
MRPYWKKSLRLLGFAALLIPLAGCFQSAGGDVGGISVAQNAGPTFTPFPTDPPIVQEVIVTATQDPNAIVQMFPTQDPNLIGNTIPTTDPNAGFTIQQSDAALDPLEMTATFIVGQATEQAGIELTQTAQAIFGIPTATEGAIFATATLAGNGTVINGSDCIHEVSATDSNLYRISLQYGVTPQEIATASGLANMNLIYVGQKLTIPGCGTTGVTPPATTIPDGTGGTGGPVGQTYVVVQGDTLFKISQRFGVPVTSIANANGISNINLIVINQQLVIPPA